MPDVLQAGANSGHIAQRDKGACLLSSIDCLASREPGDGLSTVQVVCVHPAQNMQGQQMWFNNTGEAIS
jgi:hypothetical protein